MAGNKTASLLGCACELGAMVGDVDTACVRTIRLFGYHLGLAFQLTDDLLGIWGDPATTGKPARSDLRSRKKTLPIVAALATDTPDRQRLAALYSRSESLDDVELATVASLIEQAGGRAWAHREAVRHMELALDYLNQTRPTPHATTRLTALATLATPTGPLSRSMEIDRAW